MRCEKRSTVTTEKAVARGRAGQSRQRSRRARRSDRAALDDVSALASWPLGLVPRRRSRTRMCERSVSERDLNPHACDLRCCLSRSCRDTKNRRSELRDMCPRGDCTKKPILRTAPDQRVCDCRAGRCGVTGAARLPLVEWWCTAGASRDPAVLGVLSPGTFAPSACCSGAPLIAIAARDSRAAPKSSATDLRISSRVSLAAPQPSALRGMNRAPGRLYHAVAVVVCVRAIGTAAENDVAGTSPEPGQAKPAQ
jgi:hypothetical protein